MTEILNVTPEAEKKDDAVVTAPKKPAEDAPKPGRRVPPARTVEQPKETTKWIRLDRGGTYGYKRAIYENGKVYEVDLATAEHLLSQSYIVGDSHETVEVHYFTEVAKKK